MTVSYTIELNQPHSHEFVLSMRFAAPNGAQITLPAWIPGSYMIRDFAKHITRMEARDAQGNFLALHKIDKQSWQLEPSSGEATIHYRVYAWDLSVRKAYFDQTRAYFNGSSLFLRIIGQEAQAHHLLLQKPTFAGTEAWQVATTLPPQTIDEGGFGEYIVSSYAQLIDHPCEIGQHTCAEFMLDDIPHRMVFTDAPAADIQRIARDVRPICAEHAAMFGELPVQQYLFMTLATVDSYGGLEHMDSTSLICKRSDLPYTPGQIVDKSYREFLALCSHEYFHLWNIKRIRPAAIAQSELTHEAHTELLWAFEGITSYYDELALPRAGVISPEAYLDMLAVGVTRYLSGTGRLHQSVAESSFDAWTKFYQQDENAPNAIVSYYTKGSLIALGLDVHIRQSSEDRLCLEDLMRHLWQKFGRDNTGLAERSIERELGKLLGQPVDDFFAAYIYGTDELPLYKWFAALGVGLRLRSAQKEQDTGGYIQHPAPGMLRMDLGAQTSVQGELLKIDNVLAKRPAQQAGLAPGDLLLAIEGERCTQSNLQTLLNRKLPGEQVKLTLFRRGLLLQLDMPIQLAPENVAEFYWLDESEVSPAVIQRRQHWLSSVQDRANRTGH
jgi:predicted metalloprotease with PDZ domain